MQLIVVEARPSACCAVASSNYLSYKVRSAFASLRCRILKPVWLEQSVQLVQKGINIHHRRLAVATLITTVTNESEHGTACSPAHHIISQSVLDCISLYPVAALSRHSMCLTDVPHIDCLLLWGTF